LKKANEELSVLDEAKSNFLNILSHEIRTPLNGITGFLHLLKTRIDDESLINLLLNLEVGVKRLEKFSFGALLITTLNAQKRITLLTDVDVFKLLEYVLMNFSDQISEKKLTINLDNFQQDLCINTDSDLLSESLKRIIDNAIVFTDDNSVITIANDKLDGKDILIISDNGKGFSSNVLDQGLTMFAPGEKHVDQNVGIDLYLVNLIMKTLKGKLEYGNNKDKGAFVKLYL
jgi:two-component system sensor histidine kinase/response regulator